MEEIKIDSKPDTRSEQRKQVQKEIMSLSTSILAGAVIVGASVLFAANIISRGSSTASVIQTTNPSPTGTEALTSVTERKSAPQEGNGKVVVEEFSDFQCPFCKSFFDNTYPQLKKDYIDTNKITFIYRHFPLTNIHKNAEIAAEAAECANVQGKFWDYYNVAFANSKSDGTGLNTADLKKYASDLGFDTTKFNSCLDKNETASIVASDMSAGQSGGVTGTPTFFINGQSIVGAQPYSVFQSAIDSALRK